MWDIILNWLANKDIVKVWMIVVWLIWNNRNNYFHNLTCRTPFDLVAATICYDSKQQEKSKEGADLNKGEAVVINPHHFI